MNYLDPSGLKVELDDEDRVWFLTPEEAAYYFGVNYNKESIEYEREDETKGIEYSGVIYSKVFYEYNDCYYTITEIAKMAAQGEIPSMRDFLIACRKNGGIVRLYFCGLGKEGTESSVSVDYVFGKYGRIEGVVHTHGAPGMYTYNDEYFSTGGDGTYFKGGDKLYAEDIHDYGIKYVLETLSLRSREEAHKGRGIDGFVAFLITPSGAIRRYRPGIDASPPDYDITDEIPHTKMIYPRR